MALHDQVEAFVRVHGGPPVRLPNGNKLCRDGALIAPSSGGVRLVPPEQDATRAALARLKWHRLMLEPAEKALTVLSRQPPGGYTLAVLPGFVWRPEELGPPPLDYHGRIDPARAVEYLTELARLRKARVDAAYAEVLRINPGLASARF
jgi:hypothetical protein